MIDFNKIQSDFDGNIPSTGRELELAFNNNFSKIQQPLSNIIDKPYAKFSGYGRSTVPCNFYDGINILLQSAFPEPKTNTIFMIHDDFDLSGKEIALPLNSILNFQGGSFKNGTLKGNESIILETGYRAFKNVLFDGTYKNAILTLDTMLDGTAQEDNTDVLNSIIKTFAGCKLLFGKGRYLTRGIDICESNIHLEGTSIAGTVLVYKESLEKTCLEIDKNIDCTDIKCTDIKCTDKECSHKKVKIKCPYIGHNGAKVIYTSTIESIKHNIQISNLTIECKQKCVIGLDVTSISNSEFKNLLIRETKHTGIYAHSSLTGDFKTYCIYNTFANVTVWSSEITGMKYGVRLLSQCNSNTFIRCRFSGANYGISIEDHMNADMEYDMSLKYGCNQNTFVGCAVEPAYECAIYVNAEHNTFLSTRLEGAKNVIKIGDKDKPNNWCKYNTVIAPTIYGAKGIKYDVDTAYGNYIVDKKYYPYTGTTEQRPILSANDIGVSYMDTTLGIPVWWNGGKWVDSQGNIR